MEEEKQNSEEDMKEVEVLEFSLTGEEIDELIGKLTQLKQLKTSISFDVDEENEFVIHYESAGDVEEPSEEVGEQKEEENKKEVKESHSEENPQEIPTLEGIERQ